MAYDPEARKDSNTALIAGVAALILVIAAVAFFATRQPQVVEVPATGNTVVIQTEATPVIEQVPVVVDAPTAAPPVVIERNTNTVTNRERVIVATPVPNQGNGDTEGAPNGAAGTRGSTNTNVTINVPPSNTAPVTSPTRAPAPRDNGSASNGGVTVEGNAKNPAEAAPAPRDSGY